jgi:hypothetical protein
MSTEFAGIASGLGYLGPVDSMIVPAGSGLVGSYGICVGPTCTGGGSVCCAVAGEVQAHNNSDTLNAVTVREKCTNMKHLRTDSNFKVKLSKNRRIGLQTQGQFFRWTSSFFEVSWSEALKKAMKGKTPCVCLETSQLEGNYSACS